MRCRLMMEPGWLDGPDGGLCRDARRVGCGRGRGPADGAVWLTCAATAARAAACAAATESPTTAADGGTVSVALQPADRRDDKLPLLGPVPYGGAVPGLARDPPPPIPHSSLPAAAPPPQPGSLSSPSPSLGHRSPPPGAPTHGRSPGRGRSAGSRGSPPPSGCGPGSGCGGTRSWPAGGGPVAGRGGRGRGGRVRFAYSGRTSGSHVTRTTGHALHPTAHSLHGPANQHWPGRSAAPATAGLTPPHPCLSSRVHHPAHLRLCNTRHCFPRAEAGLVGLAGLWGWGLRHIPPQVEFHSSCHPCTPNSTPPSLLPLALGVLASPT
jgi:hypothetical protein